MHGVQTNNSSSSAFLPPRQSVRSSSKLPHQLYGSYKKYKLCTETFIDWLYDTALVCGFKLASTQPPKPKMTKTKRRKAATVNDSENAEYTLSTKKLEEMALFIADYNTRVAPVKLPKRIMLMGHTAVALRRRCARWFLTLQRQRQQQPLQEGTKAGDTGTESDAGRDAEDDIKRHSYFADVLKRILDMLQPCVPHQHRREAKTEGDNDPGKWHQMQRGAHSVRPSRAEKGSGVGEGVEVSNEYSYLDLDQIDDEIFEHTAEDDDGDQAECSRKKNAEQNKRHQSAAQRRKRQRVRLESTSDEKESDPLLQVFCLLEDLDNIRTWLKEVWANYKADSSVDELIVASVLHNSAIDLVRRIVEEFAEQNASTYPTYETIISAVMAQFYNGTDQNVQDTTIGYHADFAPIAERIYLPMYLILKDFVQSGITSVPKEIVALDRDRSRMTLQEIQVEARVLMAALIPELVFFAGPPQWLVIHDDISRGLAELMSNAVGAKQAPKKEIQINKNNKTNNVRSRYVRSRRFDPSEKFNTKDFTITNNNNTEGEAECELMEAASAEEMERRAPIPLWLAFACQTMIDVLHVLGTHAPRARTYLMQRSLEIRAMIGLHFGTVTPPNVNEPETDHTKYLKAVENDLAILSDAALEWGIKDGMRTQKDELMAGQPRELRSQLDTEFSAPPFWLFDHHPMLSGLITYSFTLALQGMSVQYVNTYCTPIFCAQLYNVAKQTVDPTLHWNDMETLINLHTPDVFFAGAVPTSFIECYKRSLLVCGIKSSTFAARKGKHNPRSLQETLGVGPKALISDSSPVMHLLHERYCHHAVRANGALDFSMPVLKELIGAYHKSLSQGQQSDAKETENRKHRGVNHQKLTTLQLLDVLGVSLRNERTAMTFDYISMHRQIVGLLTKILNALRPELMEVLGMYPMYTFEESPSGIIYLCSYLMQPPSNARDADAKADTDTDTDTTSPGKPPAGWLLVKAARLMAEWLREPPTALGPTLNRIHCAFDTNTTTAPTTPTTTTTTTTPTTTTTTNGTLDLTHFNRRK
eukprot:TRINITY_DN5044_c0_g1_i2.p1 TRINITY_DN5044_c0_g1~~TRINITY_DN5044_c0_g1_i2.p1  ORF type:complete len:1041 (-),score=228.81 TRINITY_DN5044_c0_g1_i2:284-3406(-)